MVLSTLKREFLAAGDRPEAVGLRPAAPLHAPAPGEVVYQDPYHTVYKLGIRVRDVEREYRVIESGSRAGVLPVKGDRVLLVRQYRLLVDGLSWEIPGGKIEEGERPQEAAARECLEETGIECRQLQVLAGYHPGMDTFCNPTYLYYSSDIREGAGSTAHQGETVEAAWFSLDEVLGMILSLHIVDAFTMIGILTYKMRREQAGCRSAATG